MNQKIKWPFASPKCKSKLGFQSNSRIWSNKAGYRIHSYCSHVRVSKGYIWGYYRFGPEQWDQRLDTKIVWWIDGATVKVGWSRVACNWNWSIVLKRTWYAVTLKSCHPDQGLISCYPADIRKSKPKADGKTIFIFYCFSFIKIKDSYILRMQSKVNFSPLVEALPLPWNRS